MPLIKTARPRSGRHSLAEELAAQFFLLLVGPIFENRSGLKELMNGLRGTSGESGMSILKKASTKI